MSCEKENCCKNQSEVVIDKIVNTKVSFIDNVLNRVVSRKFAVWLTGTVFFLLKILPPEMWITLCGIYLGGQSVIDLLKARK